MKKQPKISIWVDDGIVYFTVCGRKYRTDTGKAYGHG